MARYQLAGQFWQITRVGPVLTVRYGKLGNKGRTSVKHFANDGAAVSAHDQLVLEKQREGFRLVENEPAAKPTAVEAPSDDERGPALEAAIAADPEDAEAYAVYGDWLQRHDDPRGELIALQLAAEAAAQPRPGTRSPASAAVGKHLTKHAAQLLGPLAKLVPDIREPDGPPFTWRRGFIHRVVLASLKGQPLGATLADVLAHPSAKLVVEVDLRADDREDALAAIDALATAGPPALRGLELFARANLDVDDRVLRALSRLERLGVTARGYDLRSLELPTLRRLRLLATAMRASPIRAVAAAPWPVLERLEIRFCSGTGACEADFADLRPLLHRTDVPALTHLKLRGAPFAGAVARALTTSPLARQLHVLDFSSGNFTPQDIAVLAAHAASFPNLRELWMPFERLTALTMPGLAAVARHVIPDSRGPLDTLDYDLAGEAVPRGDERYGGSRE